MNVDDRLAHVEHEIGRIFEDKLIAIESLNSDGQPIYYKGGYNNLRRNDNLAIIGDKAIDLVLSIMWYRSRDSQGLILCLVYWMPHSHIVGRPLIKGHMSDLQRDLVSETSLASRGFSHGLDACVIKNAGHSGQISNRMMATAVEAIVGAVFKDSRFDLEAVRLVMDNLGFFNHPQLEATDCSSLTVDG